MANINPFTPAFGGKPQHFFGREHELRSVREALANELSPHRALFVTGNRGFGKTALIEQMSIMASKQKWLTIDVQSTDAAMAILKRLSGGDEKSSTRGVSPSGFGFSLGEASSMVATHFAPSDLTDVLLARTRELTVHRGVFITVDEAQKLAESDAEAICAAVQMALRKGAPVMLVLAGLPGAKERIASYKGCTFMWRTEDLKIGSLKISETNEAFRLLFGLVPDIEIAPVAIRELADTSQGHPYLIQLLGYHLVEHMHDAYEGVGKTVSTEDIAAVTPHVLDEYRGDVLVPAFAPLRGETLEYLRAMPRLLDDEGKCATGAIAEALGKSVTQCSSYRKRLIDRRLIVPAGRGFVRFGLPWCTRYFDDDFGADSHDSDEWVYTR